MQNIGVLTPKTLVASAARTASGNSGAITLSDGPFDDIIIEVDVTAASGTTPTLDIYVQETLDGTNYVDVAHFTQITAALTNKARVALKRGNLSDAIKEGIGDATVAANTLGLPLMTDKGRVKWVIGGTTPSFTFSVTSYADVQ